MARAQFEQMRIAAGARHGGPTLRFIRTLITVVAIFSLAGCAANAAHGDVRASSDASAMSPDACVANALLQPEQAPNGSYLIQPGDELAIDFYLNPEFNQDVTVRPDGRISLQLIGTVEASNLTPQQLATELDKAYLRELREPGVTVTVKNMPSRQIFVEGEVSHPGAFPAEQGMTALQAVAEAGGFTPDASGEAVLIRRDACGDFSRSPIDLAEALKNPGGNEDQVLQSRDVLVVTPSTIANIDQWMDHYVRRLMPMQPYFAATAPPF